jgi:hemolysin D
MVHVHDVQGRGEHIVTDRHGPAFGSAAQSPAFVQTRLPRAVLYALVLILACAVGWMFLGRLDMVAVAPGKVVPQRHLKVVQPAESGIVREILVADGSRVQAGHVLMRMDQRLAQADRVILQTELALRRLNLRRIAAELEEVAFVKLAGDPDDLHAQVHAQLLARSRAHADALAAEKAALAKAAQDLNAAQETEAKLRRTAPIYVEQERAWSDLEREGYAGRLMVLERRRSRIENEQDLQAQSANVASLRALVELGERRVAQVVSAYRRELTAERAELTAQRERLEQDMAKLAHRAGLLELRSPASGRIKDLATHTPGTVVAPGTVLATIVPDEEPLEAEVWISNLDSGLVRPGSRVRLKVAAYPYQRHGMIDGVLRHISADASERPEGGGSRAGQASLHFRALVTLTPKDPAAGTTRLELVPGMQVTAEIHMGTRTVFQYLWSPLRKTLGEAGRES